MRTDSTYDTQTRALFAIAEVFDPYGKGQSESGVPLPPGLFVDAYVNGKKYEDVIVLPRDALRPENEVSVGELVILSPMERSRVSMTLKVLDANDPNVVLVDPPEPEWMKKMKAKQASEGEKKRRWGKKKKSDGDNKPERPLKKGEKKEDGKKTNSSGEAGAAAVRKE